MPLAWARYDNSAFWTISNLYCRPPCSEGSTELANFSPILSLSRPSSPLHFLTQLWMYCVSENSHRQTLALEKFWRIKVMSHQIPHWESYANSDQEFPPWRSLIPFFFPFPFHFHLLSQTTDICHWRQIPVGVKKGTKDTENCFPTGSGNVALPECARPSPPASLVERYISPMVTNETPADVRSKWISRRQSPWRR